MVFPRFLRVALVAAGGAFEVAVTPQNKTVITGGSERDFFNLMSRTLGFDFELSTPTDGHWGSLENGRWNGVIGMVHRNEVDIAIGKISITPSRKEAVDFSYPYDLEDLTFATADPGFVSKYRAIVTPFDFTVWIYLFALTFALIVTFRLGRLKKESAQRITFKFIGYLFSQPLDIVPIRLSVRILVLTWLVGARFIPLTYSTALLSFMTLPRPEEGVDTIYDLSQEVAEGRLNPITFKTASYTSTLLQNEQSMVKVISRSMVRNEGWTTPGTVREDMRKDERNVLIASRYFLRSTFRGLCVSEDSFFTLTRSLVIRKDFCCPEAINNFLMWANAGGLYNKVVEDVLFKLDMAYNLARDYEPEWKHLTLEDLSGAFLVLVGGYGLSVIVWGIEVGVYNFKGKCLYRRNASTVRNLKRTKKLTLRKKKFVIIIEDSRFYGFR